MHVFIIDRNSYFVDNSMPAFFSAELFFNVTNFHLVIIDFWPFVCSLSHFRQFNRWIIEFFVDEIAFCHERMHSKYWKKRMWNYFVLRELEKSDRKNPPESENCIYFRWVAQNNWPMLWVFFQQCLIFISIALTHTFDRWFHSNEKE